MLHVEAGHNKTFSFTVPEPFYNGTKLFYLMAYKTKQNCAFSGDKYKTEQHLEF